VLTAPNSRKEVRQFGFDISEHDVTYAAGDSLGVYATNDPATVDAWLAATGLRGDTPVEVDGQEHSLHDALIASYDICRVTPDLLRFVAESCAELGIYQRTGGYAGASGAVSGSRARAEAGFWGIRAANGGQRAGDSGEFIEGWFSVPASGPG